MKEFRFEKDANVKNAALFRTELLAAMDGESSVTVDLSNQRRLDLSIAQILYSAQMEARSRGVSVKLSGLNSQIRLQLEICGLIK